ncbi:MAG TPA: DUF190 domain-containing protein [Gaiellaceae bacterium]
MNVDALKLTVYFGESDRVEGRLLSDALVDLFARHETEASLLLRAVEGFGLKHRLRTSRFLTLSEDLPLVAIAVDRAERIEALLPQVLELVGEGLVTLERARLLRGRLAAVQADEHLHEETKLTLYLGRDERVRGVPAHVRVVDHLHRHGLAGATVLLGVDGTARGRRERARFLARNGAVPLTIVSIGSGEALAAALPGLADLVLDPAVTLERVRVCKRDGALLARPQEAPGDGVWQQLTVYSGEQARHGGRPQLVQLVRALREEGASGATAVRGIRGFSGDHAPHGDRLLSLRRRVPVVTTIVDEPERMRRLFDVVDELTDETGLVVSELVPAYRAVASEGSLGTLRIYPTS